MVCEQTRQLGREREKERSVFDRLNENPCKGRAKGAYRAFSFVSVMRRYPVDDPRKSLPDLERKFPWDGSTNHRDRPVESKDSSRRVVDVSSRWISRKRMQKRHDTIERSISLSWSATIAAPRHRRCRSVRYSLEFQLFQSR